ncbi:retinoic acid-induced protein 2 [Myxocyprinus asiaticus]|uniref:retinoic acid-induced protein 2 n=1 Tax=Myxocyprinus asiaticus TaxID=70543 RepID=UPI0022226F8D|nr:retinoic acid-induced protein 2 [Myxocyprinus asiaticus]XP_051528815.1 retinoic acid-induced protein 2 [Myxocyprinus asiaticus]
MEDLQTKVVKMCQSRQADTEIPDEDGACTSDSYSFNSIDQTKNDADLETSTEFSHSNEHSLSLALKMATSLQQSFCLGNSSVIVPVHLQLTQDVQPHIDERELHPFNVPASSTISMPLVLEQQVHQYLNSQPPHSLHSCPFANIQTNTLSENSLLSQPQHTVLEPEALLYNKDVPTFQNQRTGTALEDLKPFQKNYSPDLPFPFAPNFLPNETVPSLVPPATLLVPYPVVVPLPVPLPIPVPIPIQIPQSPDSKIFIKTSRTGTTMNKSTQTSTEDLPTISCCGSYSVFPPTQLVSQDEVLDLSLKTTQTQTKQEHMLSASPNTALDLSVARSITKRQFPWHGLKSNRLFNTDSTKGSFLDICQPVKCLQRLNHDDVNSQRYSRQSAHFKWTIGEGNGKVITHSNDEAHNGRTVSSTQTVKVIVSATETVPPILCDKQRYFSSIHMNPESRQDSLPQECFRRPKTHSLFSERHRQDRTAHFKRSRSQHIQGHTALYSKQHLASFLPSKYSCK